MIVYLQEHKLFSGVLFCSVAFLCGGLVGLWLTQTYLYHPPCQSKLVFINKSIACGEKNVIGKTNYTDFQVTIASYIATEKGKGNVSDVGVYFRDLNNGPVFSISESEDFSPASLLKLPLAFVFFNIAEKDGTILNQSVSYTDIQSPETQTFAPTVSAKPNTPYSIETLISNMLTYSDNISYQMLVKYLNGQPSGSDQINQTFQDLGIIDPRADAQNTVTVRGYASLFRLLYNASYLNADDSEKILSWLSHSDFDVGLVAGVPKGIIVAHKFGEREIMGSVSIDQLHDCGIVYYPGNPYELCVMTRGVDIKKLPSIISTISSMVYKEVDSRKL